MGKLQKFLSINLCQFLYYNFLCSNIIRDKGKYIVPKRNTKIELDKTAKIILHDHLLLNENKYPHSKAECYLRLRAGAMLTVTGKIKLMYNGTIEVHKNADLQVGSSVIQSGAVIICAYKMRIGEDCLFARMCYVSDSDHHRILNEEGETINYPRETVIGDHVWVGVKATIMKGAKIKSGSAIGANALVGGHIHKNAFMMGEPARQFSEIVWVRKGFGDWIDDRSKN